MKRRITVEVLRRLVPKPGERVEVYDSLESGLHVRCSPGPGSTTHRVWYVVYRFPATREGRQRRMKLGEYGTGEGKLSIQEARDRAAAVKRKVAANIDPMAERDEQRREAVKAAVTVKTVKDLGAEYLERYAKPHKRTWKADEKRMERHILPHLGTVPLADVKRSDARTLYERIGREHGKREAEHVRVLLSGMFTQAAEWEIFDGANPAKWKTGRFKPHRRKRTLRAEEASALLRTLDTAERDGKVKVKRDGKELTLTVDSRVVPIIRLLLLTGLRSSEVRERKWEDFDRKGRTLFLGTTKAGTARTVPLSDAAVEVLKRVPRVVGVPWIFPGRPKKKGEPPSGPISQDFTIKQWRRIALAAGLAEWVRRKGKKERERWYVTCSVKPHDIRHHVATDLANRKVPAQTLQKILGHQAISTTMGYVHAADTEARAAMEDYTRDVIGGAAE